MWSEQTLLSHHELKGFDNISAGGQLFCLWLSCQMRSLIPCEANKWNGGVLLLWSFAVILASVVVVASALSKGCLRSLSWAAKISQGMRVFFVCSFFFWNIVLAIIIIRNLHMCVYLKVWYQSIFKLNGRKQILTTGPGSCGELQIITFCLQYALLVPLSAADRKSSFLGHAVALTISTNICTSCSSVTTDIFGSCYACDKLPKNEMIFRISLFIFFVFGKLNSFFNRNKKQKWNIYARHKLLG